MLNLIKIAIAKNINKTPITIKAIFIRLVIVELPDVWLFETLLTVEELELEEDELVDVFSTELLTEEFVLVVLDVFVVDESTGVWVLDDVVLTAVFSVRFKSIP